MSVGTTILALVSYPLLSSLPLNFVRVRWSFRKGLIPMPADVQERAEAADRLVFLVVDLSLLTLVVLLLHGSPISIYAVGLTSDNWKSAIGLGILVSYVPLGLSALLRRLLTPDQIHEEPESRGALATWCGLTVLGSFSTEFWRAFCIADLIRLDFPKWVPVLVVAVAFGSSQLTTSIGRAAGAAAFGGVAGFLFVKTGSLLAPLAMSLIAAGAHLYQVRQTSSRIPSNLASFEHYVGSQTKGRMQNNRRYVTCAVCSAGFDPRKVERTRTTFTCPECGEMLEYAAEGFDYFLFFLCLYGVPAFLYFLGYRYFGLLFVSIVAMPLTFFVGTAIRSLIVPPKAKQKLSYGDSGLHLTDKTKRPENHRST
jgi:predicted RNA-binding Zn-ribbon protein involved in translation (DUF1610 family)